MNANGLLVAVTMLGCLCAMSSGWARPESEQEYDDAGLVKVGAKAPLFTLKDENGKEVKLETFLGKKNVVLIFYPGDNTPGCTKQLCAVRDDYTLFQEADVAVFGVNPQSAESHKKFSEKRDFPFPLLVDEEKRVLRLYGAKGILLTKRTVYGIDKKGRVVFAERGMPSNETVLAAFQPTDQP